MSTHSHKHIDQFSAAGLLVAVGIVFGDIGTSPLYTYRAIIEEQSVTETLALGGRVGHFLVDDPFTTKYSVDILEPEEVVRITFRLGFRVQPRINLLFRKVVEEMVRCHEITLKPKYKPLGTHPNFIGDFRFIVINRFLSYENELGAVDSFVMSNYFSLKRVSLADERAYGLDTQNVTTEQVPLIVRPAEVVRLRRVQTTPATETPAGAAELSNGQTVKPS